MDSDCFDILVEESDNLAMNILISDIKAKILDRKKY